MTWGNHELRSCVCIALLTPIGYAHLWDKNGPTPQAERVLKQYGGPMSNDEWLVFQLAWHVWGRRSALKVEDLMRLKGSRLELATSLLDAIAQGDPEVEGWVARVEHVPPRIRGRKQRLP